MSLVVFNPNIITNHAITYTNLLLCFVYLYLFGPNCYILFQGFRKITLNQWVGFHCVCYRGVFWYINIFLVKV